VQSLLMVKTRCSCKILMIVWPYREYQIKKRVLLELRKTDIPPGWDFGMSVV